MRHPGLSTLVVAASAVLVAALVGAYGGSYIAHVTILSLLFASLATAWNIAVGFTGIKSFGHQAFFCVGAYASALLAIHSGLSPWLCAIAAGFAAACFGMLLGLPTLRLRSTAHVAISTLAFAEIVRLIMSNAVSVTRGVLGLSGIPPIAEFSLPYFGRVAFQQNDRTGYLVVALVLFLAIYGVAAHVARGPFGLALRAVRDGEAAAESLGINLVAVKLWVFVGTAFATGICGSFYAHYIQVLTPDAVGGAEVMVTIMAVTLVGGLGTLLGPVIGAFLLIGIGEALREFGNYQLLIYGTLIVFVTFATPGGFVPALDRLRRRF
jgi:branched-chain amino acid transport system permease protein